MTNGKVFRLSATWLEARPMKGQIDRKANPFLGVVISV